MNMRANKKKIGKFDGGVVRGRVSVDPFLTIESEVTLFLCEAFEAFSGRKHKAISGENPVCSNNHRRRPGLLQFNLDN